MTNKENQKYKERLQKVTREYIKVFLTKKKKKIKKEPRKI